MTEVFDNSSPKWSWPTKLVIGLTIVAILAGLLMRFRNYVGPLLLAFILSFLAYPVARKLCDSLKISWRLAVTLFYLFIVLILIGLLTLGGLALVDQAQSLFNLINNAVNNELPKWINNLNGQVYSFGPFNFDTSNLDLQAIGNQILGYVQPLLGRVGTLVTTIATSAASFLGWVAFVLLISYFITSESGGIPSSMVNVDIPGHSYDLNRMRLELRHIWNSFLRGQLILFFLTVLVYTIALMVLGLRYSFGLALLAGFGRFLPYIGPTIAWSAYVLVALFQGHTLFGLSPLAYTGIVLAVAVIIDTTFDNVISPKFLGQTLRVHPAAVLVAALVAANLFGLVGVLLAAPVLATLNLLMRYTLRKLFDLDPWEGLAYRSPVNRSFLPPVVLDRLRALRKAIRVTPRP